MATNFLSRWSQRKLSNKEGSVEEVDLDVGSEAATNELSANEAGSDIITTEPNTITADPNTPKESGVNETGNLESDHLETESSGDAVGSSVTDLPVAELLTAGAEASVKKAALRKLFLSGEFSEVDALNDYDHDYKAVKTLSKEVAETLRGWVKEVVEEESVDAEHAAKDQTLAVEESDNELTSPEHIAEPLLKEPSDLAEYPEQAAMNFEDERDAMPILDGSHHQVNNADENNC